MSVSVRDRNGNLINIVEQEDNGIDKIKNRFLTFNIYGEFNELTDPVEGLKKIYDRISSNAYPMLIHMNCGAQYVAIVQKTSISYGSAIIFGYSFTNPIYMRIYNNTWYTS